VKFLFDDESFSFETLRTAGFAAYGGADLGEVLATASHIGEGDEASWHQAWKATAQRHTHAGGLGRAHQTMFDWLDATLAPSPGPDQWPPDELGFPGN
jgi:hypothetical protein